MAPIRTLDPIFASFTVKRRQISRASNRASPLPKRPTIICVANSKGGVGKTTITLVLTDCLVSEHAKRVLVIDNDQQASASLYMLNGDIVSLKRLEDQKRTIDCYLEELFLDTTDRSLTNYTCRNVRSFPNSTGIASLVPSSERLDTVEQRLFAQYASDGVHGLTSDIVTLSKYRVTHLVPMLMRDIHLAGDEAEYDFVIIDTAAGLRPSTLLMMSVADFILVPIIPDLMSIVSTAQYLTQLNQYEAYVGRPLPEIFLMMSKVQPAYTAHIANMETLLRGRFQTVFRRRCNVLRSYFLQRDGLGHLIDLGSQARPFDSKYGIAAGNIRTLTNEILGLAQERLDTQLDQN